MTTTAIPIPPPFDPISGHVYVLPIVQELPITPPPGCWDETW
jgi:hypothetical protein